MGMEMEMFFNETSSGHNEGKETENSLNEIQNKQGTNKIQSKQGTKEKTAEQWKKRKLVDEETVGKERC